MAEIGFVKAYYIKLGRGGGHAQESIDNRRLWFGWYKQSPKEINEAVVSGKKGDDSKWQVIKDQLIQEWGAVKKADKGNAKKDYNALKLIAQSTSKDVWITFHESHLWWCRLEDSGVFAVNESDFLEGGTGGPKYRETKGWSDHDVAGQPLIISQISGRLSQIQHFMGTVCTVNAEVVEEVGCAADDLKRLLNNQPSEQYSGVEDARDDLIAKVEKGMQRLFWKDFEILADLVFCGSGWRRISVIGGTMKDVDMELEEPVTGDLYQVQVKSTATFEEFKQAAASFPGESFRRLYFVVHSPKGKFDEAELPDPEKIKLILPRRLAEMVVKQGLVDWLLEKIK